jgi:hypothetical protein
MEQGENLIFERRANRTQGGIAHGGRLCLTNRRLVFEPHRVERGLTRASDRTVRLSEIAAADVAPRTWGVFSGRLRQRLRIEVVHGSQELFVVSRASDLATQINQARNDEWGPH